MSTIIIINQIDKNFLNDSEIKFINFKGNDSITKKVMFSEQNYFQDILNPEDLINLLTENNYVRVSKIPESITEINNLLIFCFSKSPETDNPESVISVFLGIEKKILVQLTKLM